MGSPKLKGKIHCCFFHETLASVADYKQAVRQFTYTISHSIFQNLVHVSNYVPIYAGLG